MDIQYFKSAWGDIKNSRGWFGKLCLLSLLNFIPIFGQIVSMAYIYGWAREIAWGTHEPMPARLFSNDDGKFWRRGWFVFVLSFVFSLIPAIVYSIGASIESAQVVITFFGPRVTVDPFLEGLGSTLRIIGFVCMILVGILAWVGSIRVAIYDRLSAGFQFGKIWKMIRHDSNGVLRIFGMELLFSFIVGIVLSIVIFILALIVIMAGVAGLMNAGYTIQSLQYMTQAQIAQFVLQFIASAGVVGILSFLIGCFLAGVATLFIELLVVRAIGYWTMQFEVPVWGGQDDPLPFELVKEEEPEPIDNGYFAHDAYQPPITNPVSPRTTTRLDAPEQSGAIAQSAPTAPTTPVAPTGSATPSAWQDAQTHAVAGTGSASAMSPSVQEPIAPIAPIPLSAASDSSSVQSASQDDGNGESGAEDTEVGGYTEGFTSVIAETDAADGSHEPDAPVSSSETAESHLDSLSSELQALQSSASSQGASGSVAVPDSAEAMPKVTYEGPMVVSAEFVMSSEELDEMRSEAHRSHGVQDGQTGDPNIGEDGEPHVGQPEDRQS